MLYLQSFILKTSKNGTSLHTYGYASTVWKDLLTSFDGTSITYDQIGNPLSWRDGTVFTWRAGRQLATLRKVGTGVDYSYSSDGTRLTKTVNGVKTSYTWDGSQLVSQTTTGGDTLYFTYHGNSRVAVEYKGNTYYYIYNLQGDVVGLVNSSGTSVVSYTYDAWGNPESTTGSMTSTLGTANPFRYRSYYFDTESGLYYLMSRYYDPVVGRFINSDAIMGVNSDMTTYNLFVYCGNNPVSRKDSTGYVWEHCGKQYEYDGSMADFHRAERGQAPLAYDKAVESCSCRQYLPEGGVTDGGITSSTSLGAEIRTDAITYVSPDDVVDL